MSTKQNAKFLDKSPSKSELLTTARTIASQPPAWFRPEYFWAAPGTHWPMPTAGMNWGLPHEIALPQVSLMPQSGRRKSGAFLNTKQPPLGLPWQWTEEAAPCPVSLRSHRPAPDRLCGITTPKIYGPFCPGMSLQNKYPAQGSDLTPPNSIQLSPMLSAFSHSQTPWSFSEGYSLETAP